MKSATVRARIEPELKSKVEDIFHELGLSTTEAITIFFTRVSQENGIPFSLKVPNKETLKVFEKTDKGIDIVKCNDVQDMFKKLGI